MKHWNKIIDIFGKAKEKFLFLSFFDFNNFLILLILLDFLLDKFSLLFKLFVLLIFWLLKVNSLKFLSKNFLNSSFPSFAIYFLSFILIFNFSFINSKFFLLFKVDLLFLLLIIFASFLIISLFTWLKFILIFSFFSLNIYLILLFVVKKFLLFSLFPPNKLWYIGIIILLLEIL